MLRWISRLLIGYKMAKFSVGTMAKVYIIKCESLLYSPCSLDLVSGDYYLFTNLNRLLQRKRFGSSNEFIEEIVLQKNFRDTLGYVKGDQVNKENGLKKKKSFLIQTISAQAFTSILIFCVSTYRLHVFLFVHLPGCRDMYFYFPSTY